MLSDYQKRAGGDLPQAIRAIRLARGLTGRAFGRLIGANPEELSTYESGRKKPGVVRLIRLIRLAPQEDQAPLIAELKRQGLSLSDIGTPLSHTSTLPQPNDEGNIRGSNELG